METRSRKRKEQPSNTAAANTSKSNKRGRKSEAAEAVEPSKRACQQGRASKRDTKTAAAVSPRATSQSTKEAKRSAATGKDKKQEAQPAKMDSSSRRLRSENEDDMMDDDHDDMAAQLLGRSAGGTSSALQGLLRKLGAGLDDVFPGVSRLDGSRFREVITALRTDDEMQQLEALSHLCEVLSMSTDDTLAAFPVEQTVPLLINILNVASSPELLVLAARALTFLADVLPSSCSAIVRHDGVPALCTRLLTIEYIDLAEQSLQALEKLSNEHPQACLRSGALLAVLSYIDFFQTGVQRVAVATAANMCRGLTAEHLEPLQSAIPILTNLLQYDDAKVVDNACLALTRVAEAFSNHPEHLGLLASGGVVAAARQLVDVPQGGTPSTQLSVSTYFGLIKLLATCAAGCAPAFELLLQSRISTTLKALLSAGACVSTSLGGAGALSSSEQTFDCLTLASVLLPPVPDAMQYVLAVGATGRLDVEVPLTAGPLRAPERQLVARAEEAKAFVEGNPDLLQQFAEDLLPMLLQLHASTVVSPVRTKCLATITKIVQHAPPAMLTVLLQDLPASSFIAGLLTSKEPAAVCAALQLATTLLTKLPNVFGTHFIKEGVVHALRQLSSSNTDDSDAGQASRTRRGTRATTRTRSRGGDDADEAPPPLSFPLSTSGVSSASGECARLLSDAHFGGHQADAPVETDGIRALRTLCNDLDTPATWSAMCELLAGNGDTRVSTFEFLNSGALHHMAAYLQGQDLVEQGLAEGDIVRIRLERVHGVVHALLPRGSGMDPPALSLVRRLQSCLSSLEALPVTYVPAPTPLTSIFRMAGLSGMGSSSSSSAMHLSSSLSNGLAALNQPLKLRLCKDPEAGKHLRDYGSTVVLVDPLASLTAVEDFLWARVDAGERAGGVSSSGGRAGGGGKAPASAPAKQGGEGPAGASPRRQGLRSHSQQQQQQAAAGAPSSSQQQQQQQQQKQQPSSAPIRAPRGRRHASTDASSTPGSSGTPQQGSGGSGSMRRVTRYMMRQLSMQSGEGEGDGPHSTGGGARGPTPEKVLEGRASDVVDDEGAMIEVEDEEDEDNEGEYDDDVLGHFEGEEMHDDEDEDDDDDDDDDDHMDDDDEDDDDDDAMGQEGAIQRHASRVKHVNLEEGGGAGGGAAGRAGHGGRTTHDPPPPSNTAPSYAQAARASEQQPPRLVFFIDGQALHPSTTVFQAVQSAAAVSEDGSGGGAGSAEGGDGTGEDARRRRRIWEQIHKLQYRLYDPARDADVLSNPPAAVTAPRAAHAVEGVGGCELLLDTSVPADLSNSLGGSDGQHVLYLLRLLFHCNTLAHRLDKHMHSNTADLTTPTPRAAAPAPFGIIPASEFVSDKMAAKFRQQLKDVVAICGGSLPAWCRALAQQELRFLTPFDLRRQYMYCTSFGMVRALHYLEQLSNADAATRGSGSAAREHRMPRLQRQKVRISRKRILESAAKVMELYAAHKVVLELEYQGEVGTGLGPTLEFYTLLSHELQRRTLHMWRSSPRPMQPDGVTAAVCPAEDMAGAGADPDAYVHAPLGLFPAPMDQRQASSEAGKKTLGHFRLLGRAMAKALQDNRLMDIPLNHALLRRALGSPLSLYDVREIDADLGNTLEKLAGAAHAAAGGPAFVDGVAVEDLCLTYQVPGYPQYHMGVPDNTPVTSTNLGEYVAAVVDATVGHGIDAQMDAFCGAFCEVFDIATLRMFSPEEVDTLLCGTTEAWTAEGLADVIKFDHGYTTQSPAAQHLLAVLGDMDATEQRRFLRFVTGSPRLPPGGLAALQPRLTVVRKHSGGGEQGASAPSLGPSCGSLGPLAQHAADADLPSVMTCANYIKLPPYSSKEVLKSRIMFVIHEGQGSFDLS